MRVLICLAVLSADFVNAGAGTKVLLPVERLPGGLSPLIEACRARIASLGFSPTSAFPNDPMLVIVDRYSSSSELAAILLDLKQQIPGLRILHVHSHGHPPAALAGSFNMTGMDEDIAFQRNRSQSLARDINELARHIRQKGRPLMVLQGTETGVVMAGHLARALNRLDPSLELPFNSRPRRFRHKGQMMRAVRPSLAPKTFEARHIDDAITWIRREKLLQGEKASVFVKPPEGAAGELGARCFTEDQVRRHFDKIRQTSKFDGTNNPSVLIQEFIPGDESPVDAVTLFHKGVYYTIVTGIWDYRKIEVTQPDGSALVQYEADRLMDPLDDRVPALVAAHQLTIEDLGLRVGVTHGEFKHEPLKLIETAQRWGGSDLPWIEYQATGENPFVIALEAYLAPELFLRRFENGQRFGRKIFWAENHRVLLYERERFAATVEFTAHPGTVIADEAQWTALRAIPGFVRGTILPHGTRTGETESLLTTLGSATVVHNDPAVFEESLRRLLKMNRERFFYTP